MIVDELGPFDSVLDVGGNVGEFAELCRVTWPAARITSFEPLPELAKANERRASGRWWVEEAAISDRNGNATIRRCVNQHSASTMQPPGTLRRDRFGIVDRFVELEVPTRRLDDIATPIGRTLLKVDVEGHELQVLHGASHVLGQVAVVIVEVNQHPDIFVGAPSPDVVDALLREHGLYFAGVAGVQLDPAGVVVQFDGVWSRQLL